MWVWFFLSCELRQELLLNVTICQLSVSSLSISVKPQNVITITRYHHSALLQIRATRQTHATQHHSYNSWLYTQLPHLMNLFCHIHPIHRIHFSNWLEITQFGLGNLTKDVLALLWIFHLDAPCSVLKQSTSMRCYCLEKYFYPLSHNPKSDHDSQISPASKNSNSMLLPTLGARPRRRVHDFSCTKNFNSCTKNFQLLHQEISTLAPRNFNSMVLSTLEANFHLSCTKNFPPDWLQTAWGKC